MKEGYLKDEIDPATGYPLPGAVQPGIYVTDDETYRRLVSDPRVSKLRPETLDFASGAPHLAVAFGGATVRVATAAQIAYFEAREAEGKAREMPHG